MNGLIPSRQRATILSFDSLMTSSGGVWAQPALGRAADVWGYPPTYLISAAISLLALPFIALSRRQNAAADEREVVGASEPRSGGRDALPARGARHGRPSSSGVSEPSGPTRKASTPPAAPVCT